MNVEELIKKYLASAKMMQLATSNKDQPWACTVYFAFDQSLNLYWISTPGRRHSKEISNNPKVAGVIVLPHTPGDKARGLQFQGTAEEITEPTKIKSMAKFYEDRYAHPGLATEIISGENPHHLYQVKPELFALFDEENYPDNPRQEYKPRS